MQTLVLLVALGGMASTDLTADSEITVSLVEPNVVTELTESSQTEEQRPKVVLTLVPRTPKLEPETKTDGSESEWGVLMNLRFPVEY